MELYDYNGLFLSLANDLIEINTDHIGLPIRFFNSRFSSVVERQSCKLKVGGSILPSGSFTSPAQVGVAQGFPTVLGAHRGVPGYLNGSGSVENAVTVRILSSC